MESSFSGPGLEIATHWSPMRPKIQHWRLYCWNWSPAGKLQEFKEIITALLFFNLYKEITGSGQLNFLSPLKWCRMYKKIIKDKCTSTRQKQIFIYWAPYYFSGFFRNWDSGHTTLPCAFHCPKNNGGRCQSVVRGITWLFMGGRWWFTQKVYWKLESFVSWKCSLDPRSNQTAKGHHVHMWVTCKKKLHGDRKLLSGNQFFPISHQLAPEQKS